MLTIICIKYNWSVLDCDHSFKCPRPFCLHSFSSTPDEATTQKFCYRHVSVVKLYISVEFRVNSSTPVENADIASL